MKVIEENKLSSKYCRRKNNYVGTSHFFLKVIEELPFGKSKVDLFFLDKHFPLHRVNWIGTDIVENKFIEDYDEKNDYKDKRGMKYLVYKKGDAIYTSKGGDKSRGL